MIALVISLARAGDRRRQFVARLNAAGIDYRDIDAVLGKALPQSEVRRVRPASTCPGTLAT